VTRSFVFVVWSLVPYRARFNCAAATRAAPRATTIGAREASAAGVAGANAALAG
jgi:hypothetical protein